MFHTYNLRDAANFTILWPMSDAHQHSHFQLDRIGIGVSTLCLVHCLALPLLLTFAPFVELLTDWHLPFHIGIFILAAPVAFVSLRQGFRHHNKSFILALGGLGCGLIFLNIIFDIVADNHLHEVEPSLSLVINVLGGLLLATAHLLNIRACHVHGKSAAAHSHVHEHAVAHDHSHP